MKFGFRFGADRAQLEKTEKAFVLELANPLVMGADAELWSLPGEGHYSQSGDFELWHGDTGLCGVGVVTVDAANMLAASRQLYLQVLELTRDYTVQRFWNFIPHINALAGEVDHYMLFCQGRAEAFAQGVQPLADAGLPAASAVGTQGEQLWVIFFADQSPVQTVENPLQTPAYKYPRRYGPSSPSFARAAVLQQGKDLVVSGTASIRDSESLHVGDVRAQAELALDNIGLVVANAGFGRDLGDVCDQLVSARVYLRDAQLWPTIAPIFERTFGALMDSVRVVQAQICRPELLVEVEAHFAHR